MYFLKDVEQLMGAKFTLGSEGFEHVLFTFCNDYYYIHHTSKSYVCHILSLRSFMLSRKFLFFNIWPYMYLI